MDTFLLATCLLGASLVPAGISMFQTASHLWDPEYRLEHLSDGPQHARFHFLRELGGDFGSIAIAAMILAAPEASRTPTAWWVLVAVVVSYCGPFWASYPILGVGAPKRAATIVHLLVTVLATIGIVLARPTYIH